MTLIPPPPRTNAEAAVYVGFWRRVVASLVDSVLLSFVIFPPLIAIYGWAYLDPERTGLVAGPADLFFSWILPVMLVVASWALGQATPGKMLVSAKIADAATGGAPGLGQWIVRYIGYFVSALPFGFGFVWIAFDPRKQGWHDKMARTVVIRRIRPRAR